MQFNFIRRSIRSFFAPVRFCYRKLTSFLTRALAAWRLTKDPDALPAFKARQDELAERITLVEMSQQVASAMLPEGRHSPRETVEIQIQHDGVLSNAEADAVLEESRVDFDYPGPGDKKARKNLAEHLDQIRQREIDAYMGKISNFKNKGKDK